MISFIVPAHNEELWIAECLLSIKATMHSVPEDFEIIVVNDASTDATSRIAEQFGASVLHVDYRKISAVRNEGARAAKGKIFFFVDADTKANVAAVEAALTALKNGAVGGGCVPSLDGPVPMWGHMIHRVAAFGGRIAKLVGGCFLFCTRDVFFDVGGFSEQLYAGEDIAFVGQLKKAGRFVVPRPTVLTSARKLEVASPWQVISLLIKIAVRGYRYESPWVMDLLYGQLAQKCKNPGNVGKRK